nr:hypothetical protein REQ54_00006 [Rhizobium sp. Q54]
MGSLTSICRKVRASRVAARLAPRRVRERPSVALPAWQKRLAITRSSPARIRRSISGSSDTSCCMSPSMMAMTGADEESIPSIEAPARPRLPIRRMQRTRPSHRAMSRTTFVVPSELSSSTNMTSQAMPANDATSASTTSSTLGASLNVGTMTENSGDRCSNSHDSRTGCSAKRASCIISRKLLSVS